MNICIGLLVHSHAWEQLLLQEGIPFQIIDLGHGQPGAGCSVVIVNRPIDASERDALGQYLRTGGGVLGSAHLLSGFAGIAVRPEWIEYLIPQGREALQGLSLFDLGVHGDIPREANTLRTQTGSFAVFAGELAGGLAVLLPFDPESVFLDARPVTKNFYAQRDRLPSERVALAAKGELRHLLHACFEFLHHGRDLPYVHLWNFPDGRQNIFAFRVDTDGSSTTDVDALYTSAKEHGFGLTWFLDVRSHETWLEHFAAMTGQEIGVHCYEHRVFETYEEILRDIGKAHDALDALGIRPEGYAGPFGAWSLPLAKAVDHLGFFYSSEFSLAYDTTPFYPPSRTGVSSTLQVPIHPICPGNLTKIGYTEEETAEYFSLKVEEKLMRREPIIVYHHPGQRAWSTIRTIFNQVRQKNIECLTMGDYAKWWRQRLNVRYSIRVEGNHLTLDLEGGTVEQEARRVRLRISKNNGQEALVPLSPTVSLADLSWEPVPSYVVPADLRRIRDFDPRALLGDLYTQMVRRLR
jgi:hypothetical protein